MIFRSNRHSKQRYNCGFLTGVDRIGYNKTFGCKRQYGVKT